MKSSFRNFLAGAGTVLALMPTPIVGHHVRISRQGHSELTLGDRVVVINWSAAEALRVDWQQVGEDLQSAVDATAQEVQGHGYAKRF